MTTNKVSLIHNHGGSKPVMTKLAATEWLTLQTLYSQDASLRLIKLTVLFLFQCQNTKHMHANTQTHQQNKKIMKSTCHHNALYFLQYCKNNQNLLQIRKKCYCMSYKATLIWLALGPNRSKVKKKKRFKISTWGMTGEWKVCELWLNQDAVINRSNNTKGNLFFIAAIC